MILDTNALSAYADEDKRFEPVLRSADRCALPVTVLGKYLYGISLSKYRDEYARWLGEQLKLMEVLAVDPVTAIHFADIKCELKKRAPRSQETAFGLLPWLVSINSPWPTVINTLTLCRALKISAGSYT